jgi:hypothetical protein
MRRVLFPVAFALLVTLTATNTATAAPGDATEKLLKDAKLDYKKVKDGVFKLVIESKAGISIVIIEEKKASWKDSKGKDVLYAYIYTEVFVTGATFKPPEAMLSKLADWNDRIRFGSLGLTKNSDGSYSVFRNGSVFLKNLDAEQLEDMVYLTHNDKFLFAKEFKSFLEEK